MAKGRLGQLTIAGTPALANGYLVAASARFRREYPEVGVLLHSLQTPEILARVIGQELDMGVCYGPVDSSGVDVETVTEGHVMCVLPQSHRLAAQREIAVAELQDESLISYDPQDRLRGMVDALLVQAGIELRFSMQVSQTITAIRLVQAGCGVALVEPFYFRAMQPKGLVARPLRPLQSVEVVAVFTKGAVRSRAGEAFFRIFLDCVATAGCT